jgi:heptosyltransferase-2
MLKRCRELWPDHRLGLVCRKGVGGFLLKTGLVDELYEVQKGNSASYEDALKKIKTYEVDNLISPHESLRTVIFCSRIPAKKKISFYKFWNFPFFQVRQKKPQGVPDSLRQMSLLEFQDPNLKNQICEYINLGNPFLPDVHGQLPAPPSWASMSLRSRVLKDEKVFADLKTKFSLGFYDSKKVVLIFPGSVWATKRWTAEGFMAAGQALHKRGCQVIVMGGPGEEELAEKVAQGIPGYFSWAGKTSIYESSQLFAIAALFLGNDSASTHLAAVCETPLIAVFGPTVLEFGYRPWSAESYVVEKQGLHCRPCGKHGHKECPIGTHVCMTSISAAHVVERAQFIMNASEQVV